MATVVRISEAASLAVHAMVLIARTPEMLNVKRIAEINQASRNHLAKIMQVLVKNNYLESVRGPKGGFSLKKDPSTINLLEIYELIEGTLNPHQCSIEEDKCPFPECIFGDLANRFSADFINYLKSKTLYDLTVND